jgi:Tol biopolymer transport system component
MFVLVGVSWLFPAAAQDQPETRLFIAFASYRDRPKHPNIFFYEHDGIADGKIVGSVTTPRNVDSAEVRPSLSQDGRFCAFTYEQENNSGRIHYWDRGENKLVDLPALHVAPNPLMGPSLAGDSKLLAFTAWGHPATGPGWHILLYDMAAKKLLDLPGLNGPSSEERLPALSGDGRFLAFASNRKGGAGLTDVYLYDRKEKQVLALPELNSKHMDTEPSISADGNLIAFVSDRPGGSGLRDIYLFDRAAAKLVPLPGLNTAAHEYSPALSADGRFIAFVSERLGGAGERDVYLYDRQTQRLLPTPGLNSKADDFDPCVIVLKAKK